MKKFNKKFNETLDTLGEIGYWLGVRFERYIEENKDDILELLGILGAFFVMWWITVAIEADKIFKAILIMVIGYSIVFMNDWRNFMDCYNFSKGSFYFNLFQDFNKFFREMYISEDSNALFSQYSEKFIQFYPGDFSFDLLFALGRVTEQKTWKTISLEQYVDFFKEYYVLFRNMLGRVLTSYQSSESFCKMAYDGLEALWQKYRGIQTEKWQFGVDMLAAATFEFDRACRRICA